MRRKLLATSIVAIVGIASAGCASIPPTETEEGGATGEMVVEVTNNHPLRVTVEAVSAGTDQRLGQVETNNTERFRLPSGVSPTDLRISVDPIGSAETYVSPPVSVDGNDVITVTVESNLALTTVSVR